MTERINKAQLESLVNIINKITNSPLEYCQPRTPENPNFCSNIGHYCLDWAYGGVQLQRVDNTGGGVSQPIGGGFNTKREMYYLLLAYISGLNVNK